MTPDSGAPQSSFAPTRWTIVLRAAGRTPDAQRALSELCECYWTPVFLFLRGSGRDAEAARELAQEFFSRLLKRGSLEGVEAGRGRFRSYLLGAVKHFLADWRDHERRLKRGGGVSPEPLEHATGTGTSAALQVPDPAALPPDAVFDRAWALAVMERALAAVQAEMAQAGRASDFDALKPWLEGEGPALPQAAAAARVGMSEGAFKVAIHRLRKRFRDRVREELAQTVAGPAEVDEELRYLIDVLSRR